MAKTDLNRGWPGRRAILLFTFLSVFALKEMHLSPRGKAAVGADQTLKKSPDLVKAGIKLREFYTGIAQLDAGLSVLVAAFLPGVSGWSPGFQVQQLYFLLSFFPILCTWSIEAGRQRNSRTLIYWTSAWALFYQTLGGAVICPLYYLAYLWSSRGSDYWSPGGARISNSYAKALLPALVIGYLLPTVILYLPFDDPGLYIHQGLTAFWQPTPWWVNALIFLITSASSEESTKPSQKGKSSTDNSLKYLDAVYITGFVVAALTHISVMFMCISPNYPKVSFWDSLVRVSIVGSPTYTQSLHHIFQADFIFFFTATWFGAYVMFWDLKKLGKKDLSLRKTAALMALGLVVVGPGATVAGAGYFREQIMAEKQKK